MGDEVTEDREAEETEDGEEGADKVHGSSWVTLQQFCESQA